MNPSAPRSIVLSFAVAACSASGGSSPYGGSGGWAGSAGNAANTGGSSLGGVGGTAGIGGASGNGGSAGVGGPANGGSTGSDVPPGYPSGPYGIEIGETVSPFLQWQGYPEGSVDLGTVRASDYFDPDGSKGIRALLVITAGLWCPVCRAEAQNYLPEKLAGTWGQLGVEVLQLISEDHAKGVPATPDSAWAWKSTFSASWAVVADPAKSFYPVGATNTPVPRNVVVDPRTMRITFRFDGYGTTLAGEVEAVASRN